VSKRPPGRCSLKGPNKWKFEEPGLMIEAARSSETLVNFYQSTRLYNPEDSHLPGLVCRTDVRSNTSYILRYDILVRAALHSVTGVLDVCDRSRNFKFSYVSQQHSALFVGQPSMKPVKCMRRLSTDFNCKVIISLHGGKNAVRGKATMLKNISNMFLEFCVIS
jgi:hypothetical protein